MVDDQGPVFPFGSLLFPNIFRSFRMAIQPSKLIIAFAAVTVICLAGRLMDLSRTVVVIADGQLLPQTGLAETGPHRWRTELDVYMVPETNLRAYLRSIDLQRARTGVFATLWDFGAAQFHTAMAAILTLNVREFVAQFLNSVYRCARALIWAFEYHTVYSLVFFAVVLVALALAGGAICRLTALQFARGERPGLARAWRFSSRRLTTFAGTPLAPLVIALLLGLPIILLGVLGNIPVAGELLTGLLLPPALLLAPFVAVVLIGAAAGQNLMFPAIAYEDSDFFDAICRSFSSIYTRPWRMGFYTLAAVVYGAACYLFVRFFTFLLLWVTRGFLQLGLGNAKLQAIWPAPGFDNLLGTAAVAPKVWSLGLAALLIRIWVLAVVGLMISFVISFYFSANTIIYALMRNRVDGTPLDEVYEESEEATGEPVPADSSSQAQSPPPAGETSE